jgi:hypothetical protein
MTIAAGFVCVDGVVLAADTLYTGPTRRHDRKLWEIPKGQSLVALAGAGDRVLIEKTKDQIEQRIQADASEREILNDIETILFTIHTQSIWHDQSSIEPPSLDVLLAIRTTSGCRLFVNRAAALAPVAKSQCIGCGLSLGAYFADCLFADWMPVEHARTIAVHLLEQTKTYDKDCGGESHILSIPVFGDSKWMTEAEVKEVTDRLGKIQDGMRRIITGAGPTNKETRARRDETWDTALSAASTTYVQLSGVSALALTGTLSVAKIESSSPQKRDAERPEDADDKEST